MIFRLALRTLLKTPFVTLVAVASLALGIGANTAIYSLFYGLLEAPLPVSEPDRLVNLGAPGPKPGNNSCNQAGNCDVVFSLPMLRDLERVETKFSALAAHCSFGVNVSARRQTISGDAIFVSGGYFPALGVQPALGRLLGPDDDRVPNSGTVAVLSHSYWTTHLGSDPSVLGQAIILNGQTLTIVGVAAKGFEGTTIGVRPLAFVPISLRDVLLPGVRISSFENRRSYWVYVFARLKPGATLEEARAAVNLPYAGILRDVEAPLQVGMSAQTLEQFKKKQITVEPGAHGQTSIVAATKGALAMLLGVTFFVLLIACANVANLLLARSAARSGEMGVRLSIGAGRWQLIAQLLAESSLMALGGGVLGIVVAIWTLNAITAALPANVVDGISFGLDWSVLPMTAAVTLGTGLLFGLYPALHSTRPDLVTSLKGQAGQPSGARAARRFRTALATAQIALSLALLVAAGLFIRSLGRVSRVQLGLDPEHIVQFRVAPLLSGYDPARSRNFFERVEEGLSALPGVSSVTGSSVPLLSGSQNTSNLKVEGFDAGPDTNVSARTNRIGVGYFSTLKIPILAGRDFTRADSIDAAKVAIVNESFLRKFNLTHDAVGRHVAFGTEPGTPMDVTIVGVASDSKYSDVKAPMSAGIFTPYRQGPGGVLNFYVRTATPPETFMAQIRQVVASLDQNLPVDDLRTLPQQIHESFFQDRVVTMLSASFAALATLLAAIGLYGVLAYTVALRTKEIGLRMAIGASPGGVQRMILGQVGRMTLVGGAIGMVLAVWLGRLAESQLYELKGWDPLVLTLAALGLTLVALAAGLLPARRAARIDPMRALRYE